MIMTEIEQDEICVSPTTNLDMGNEGDVIRVDLDDRVISLRASGRLRRVDCPEQPETEQTDWPGLRDAVLADLAAGGDGQPRAQTVEPVGIAGKGKTKAGA